MMILNVEDIGMQHTILSFFMASTVCFLQGLKPKNNNHAVPLKLKSGHIFGKLIDLEL